MQNTILTLCGFVIIAVGAWMIVQPRIVADALRQFYSNYPIIHRAGKKQLTSRNGFVVGIGISFILIGVLALISLSA